MIKLGLLVPASPKTGGLFQYTQSLLKLLIKLDHFEITLYTHKKNSYYNDFNLPIKRYSSSRFFDISCIIQNQINLFLKDPFITEEIILATAYSTILLITKRKIIYTLHDLQEYYFPENFSFAQKLWRRYLHTQISTKSSLIICESSYVKTDIVTLLKIPQSKIAVIPIPPLEISKELISRENITRIINKNNIPDKYIIYPANFWPHKNHRRLIEAFCMINKKFPELYLILTGSKIGEFNNIDKLIKELNLSERIIYLGYIEYSEVLCILKQSLGLVLPTLFESISIPVYEAFQLGVPVCASSVVALPEQIGKAGILFNPLSIDSIHDAILELLTNKKLREGVIKEGYKRLKLVSGPKLENDLISYITSVCCSEN